MSRFPGKAVPLATLGLSVAAMAATYLPLAGQMMVFDRPAIIHGELWRLITGHLFHYSPLHLWSNVLPLVVVGAWIEKRNRKGFAVGCLLMALACSAGLFFAHPAMGRYGGLSGVLCGLLVYFGLGLSVEKSAVKWIGRFTLAVMIAKTGHEWYDGSSGLVDWDAHGFVVMPVSHLTGMIAGTFWFIIQSLGEKPNAPAGLSGVGRRDIRAS